MNPLLIANWVLFFAVLLYGVGLFAYLLKTRYAYIKLGKKVEFEDNMKERLRQNMGVCIWTKETIKRQEKWNHARYVLLWFLTCSSWSN